MQAIAAGLSGVGLRRASLLAFGVWIAASDSGCSGGIADSGSDADAGPGINIDGGSGGDSCTTGSCGCACTGPLPGACRCAPDAASGGTCTLAASAYNPSCSHDVDCIAVFLGNVCGDVCHGMCPNAAINVGDDARYAADLAAVPKAPPSNMGTACSCALGTAVCRAGVCSVTTSAGGPADAGEGGSSGCVNNADCPTGNFCNLQIRGSPGVCCAGLGCAPNCPNGIAKDSNGCDTCQCAEGPDGGACVTSADCAPGDVCGFLQANGCSATGSCFPPPGAVCRAYAPGCACDGTEITVACTGLPGGYVSKPLRHTGTCTGDAGAGG